MSSEGRTLQLRRPGQIAYGDAAKLQATLVRRRRAGEIPDQLLLLEHPHVISLGSGSSRAHVLADEATRSRLGIELHESGRGGDVTYHGPGQLVGYPIIALEDDRRDLHRYLRDLEDVLIGVVAGYGIEARREDGFTGVWTERGKLAAIGVRVSSGWITSHGFALNVATDLDYFDTIVPCGLAGRRVTSLAEILGKDGPTVDQVAERTARAFATHFERELQEAIGIP